MDWGDVPTWVAAMAAVIGVGFGLIQLRALSRQASIQTYSDYTRRYESIAQRFPEDVNSTAFDLSKHQHYDQTMRAMRSYFDLCFEEWDLHQRKLIEDKFWATWKGGMVTAMSKPAFRQAWAVVVLDTVFGSKFTAFFNELAGRASDTA